MTSTNSTSSSPSPSTSCTVREVIAALQTLKNQDALVCTPHIMLYPDYLTKMIAIWDNRYKEYEAFEFSPNAESPPLYNVVCFKEPAKGYIKVATAMGKEIPHLIKCCNESIRNKEDPLPFIFDSLHFLHRPIYYFPDTKQLVDSDTVNCNIALDPLFEKYESPVAPSSYIQVSSTQTAIWNTQLPSVLWISKVAQKQFEKFVSNPALYFLDTVCNSSQQKVSSDIPVEDGLTLESNTIEPAQHDSDVKVCKTLI